MKIILSDAWLDDVSKFLSPAEKETLRGQYGWRTAKGKVKVDVSKWPEAALVSLRDFLAVKAELGDESSGSAKLSKGLVEQWMELRRDPDGRTVTKLENLESAMKEYVRKSRRRWLFEQVPDGNMLPWFVEKVKYHEPTEHTSARLEVELLALNSGNEHRSRSGSREVEGKSFRVFSAEIRKRTVSQILEARGYYLETEARTKSYDEEVARFVKYSDDDGFQMAVTGKCEVDGGGWRVNNYVSVEKAGKPAKMVVDPSGKEKGVSSVPCPFWEDKPEDHLWELPVHPVLDMFDLDEHEDYRVHVNNAVPYVYDVKVGNKLVLPPDVKDFIETLVEHSSDKFVDIVGGKEGGTVILLEGPPGTGKTLSAEVYSEVMRRPLYKVQSSQLGLGVKDLEDKLKKVLQRSDRWGAILLIDEADVYIHARGDNIVQNAIVGVFLRVLEYYRGVLFMTTNRGTIIDDAIVSRLTARFRYKNPTVEEQARLWRMLADQNKVDLPEGEIELIVRKLPKLSGRDIKNLLKMAYVAAKRKGGPVTAGLVEYVSRFRQMDDRLVQEPKLGVPKVAASEEDEG